MKKKFIIIILLAITLYGNEKVSIALLWKHQFEFAGVYVAQQKGFYKDAGFDVEIKEFTNNTNIAQDVKREKTTFTKC